MAHPLLNRPAQNAILGFEQPARNGVYHRLLTKRIWKYATRRHANGVTLLSPSFRRTNRALHPSKFSYRTSHPLSPTFPQSAPAAGSWFLYSYHRFEFL